MEDQADFDRRGAEVVDELRLVDRLESPNRLELDDHTILYQEVDGIAPDDLTTVVNRDSALSLDLETTVTEGYEHRAFVR
jgi:hypothetical protein